MKRLMSSLHFTRWLRVVAIAGVVLAYGAADASAKDDTTVKSSSTMSAYSWCMRC